jgi:hypothetical protein
LKAILATSHWYQRVSFSRGCSKLNFTDHGDSIMYYAVFLFQQAGLAATSSSLLANGLQGVVLNVFTWVNMWYIDVR